MELTRPYEIISELIPPASPLFAVYMPHATLVAGKAIAAGAALGLNEQRLRFVEEAALLHDIGILRVNAPNIHCHGELPYLMHGIEGRRILVAKGLPEHALVAENHVGAGILASEIEANGLPLPVRDMLPKSVEEKLVCWADLFFSKTPGKVWFEKPLEQVRRTVAAYGEAPLARFEEMHRLCSP